MAFCNISDMIKVWIRQAPEDELRDKLAEYAIDRQDLSPRDVETRAHLANAIRAELAIRETI